MKQKLWLAAALVGLLGLSGVGFLTALDQAEANGRALIPPNLPKTVTPPNSPDAPDFWGCRTDIRVQVAKDFSDNLPWRPWYSHVPNIALCVVGDTGRYCSPDLLRGKALCSSAYDCDWQNVPIPNLVKPITVEVVNVGLFEDQLIDQQTCDARDGECRLSNSTVTFRAPKGQRFTPDSVAAMIIARHVHVDAGEFVGSGVLVDSRTVLTAWHVIAHAPQSISVTSGLADGTSFAVIGVSRPFRDVDLAILTLERPVADIAPLTMVTDAGFLDGQPRGVAALEFIGLGSAMGSWTDDFEVKCTNPIGSFKLTRDAHGVPHIELSNHSDWVSKPGMSGSGVYTANGELVGVHVAADRRGVPLPDGWTTGGYDHPMYLAPNPFLAKILGATTD